MTGTASGAMNQEQLQDLLLASPGFSNFMLELAMAAAAGLGTGPPVLCSITVEREGFPVTVASSDAAAMVLDERQYFFNEGPCLTALRQHRRVLIPDLASSRKWARYAWEIRSSGVAAILAVPVEAGKGTAAALNYYAFDTSTIDDAFILAVETLSTAISRILQLALRFHLPSPEGTDFGPALRSRALIDAAVAVIMIQGRCSRAQALQMLQQAASNENSRIRDQAIRILNQARRGHPGPMM